ALFRSQSTHASFDWLTGCCKPLDRVWKTSVFALLSPWKARLKNSLARDVAALGFEQWPASYCKNPMRSGTPSAFQTGFAAHAPSASPVPPRWHHELAPLWLLKCTNHRGAMVASNRC